MVINLKNSDMLELEYTIENMISELTAIVVHDKDLPKIIIESYEELNAISMDLPGVLNTLQISPKHCIIELKEIYQDVIDQYVIYLEKESSKL